MSFDLSSMISDRKAANAVGGKTARACVSCLRKRARWYCAADDAFLCQSCDTSVHSANQLASRHERVRLETASFKLTGSRLNKNSPVPAWHQGFTRKARTPRHPKPTLVQQQKEMKEKIANTFPLVPEMGNEETSLDENEEQLLYRVPVFDPFSAELCNISNEGTETVVGSEPNVLFTNNGYQEACDLDSLQDFVPSDIELAEFAADVESLLGTGLDDDSCGIEGLGLIDCKEQDYMDVSFEGNRVKVEDEVEAVIPCHLDWNFDYELPATGEEEEEEKVVVSLETKSGSKEEVRGKILLRLNYEAVITAWDNQGSPWTTGIRPEFNPDDCCHDLMDMFPGGIHHLQGGVGVRVGGSDGGREARVSRYREKRRTRLFSKKIRYEVRKLNAEKRPRMKGRFVKRASFAGPVFPYLINK